MKKLLIAVLALAGAQGVALCQHTITFNDVETRSKEDIMFNSPLPGKANMRFDFQMGNGNRMSLELTRLNQIDSIPRLDSLIQEFKKTYALIADSASDPLATKRIDYVANFNNRIRVLNYPQQSGIFTITKGGQVTQLKVEQDTIRIMLWSREKIFSQRKLVPYPRPFFITFYVNNLSDLDNLPIEQLESTIDIVRKEIGDNKKDKDSEFYGPKHFMIYNVTTGKKIGGGSIKNQSKFIFSSDPYVQSAVQGLRGKFVPSVGVGLRLTQRKSKEYIREWRLMWEPLFFFSRDINNKLRTDRNDFITFKQYSTNSFDAGSKKVEFVQNVSFGYLIRRKGEWLEKHTIKFALPTGIQYKNILLEPEFVFNDLFQNFSPSLKFTVIFE